MAITAAEYEARLSLNASDFQKGMKTAQTDWSGLKSTLSGVSGAIGSTLTKSIGTATTAIGALGTFSTGVGKSFESSMSQVAATMGMSAEEINNGSAEFEKLKAAAELAGSTTKYSATEAADALNFLALAGYDADKSVEVLPTVLNLAQAGALDLASASDMVTDAMSALNIEATSDNVTHFSDQLAKTASKSNTSVSQLGEAILTLGGTANYLSGGTDELNTALGILANNGLKGAESGTHLRNMILSLSAPTDTAISAFTDLGLSVNDLQDKDGSLLPLNEIMIKLNDSMEDLTDTEKAAKLSQIFNKTDLTSVNALLKDCGDSWDSLNANIKDCDGACQTMADTMNNNLEGQLLSIQSAAEGFGIAIYDEMQKPLTELAKVGSESIRELTAAFQQGGVNQLIQTGSKMLADLFSEALSYVPKVLEMAINLITQFVKGIADNSAQIADAAMSIVSILVDGIGDLLPTVINAGTQIITNLISAISAELPNLIPVALQAVTDFVQSLVDNLPLLVSASLQLVQALADGIINALPTFIDSVFQIADSLITTITDLLPQILEVGTNVLLALIDGIIDNLPKIIENAQTLVETLATGISQMTPKIIEVIVKLVEGLADIIKNTDWISLGQQLITYIIEGIGFMTELAIDVIMSLATALFDTVGQVDWLELGENIINYIIEGIKALTSTAIQVGTQVFTKLFDKIKAINWKKLGTDLLNFIKNGFLDSATLMYNTGKKVFTEVFNLIKSVDWKMLGKTILETIKTGFDNTKEAFFTIAQKVGTKVKDTIAKINWRELGKEIINTIVNAFSDMTSRLTDKAKDVFNKARNAFSSISFGDIGARVIEGIINGITNGASNLFSSLRSLASDALSAAKDALGIHSPSREFAKIGEYMMEGWAQPIQEDDTLVNAVQQTAESAIQSAQQGLQDYDDIMSNLKGQSAHSTLQVDTNLDRTKLDNITLFGNVDTMLDKLAVTTNKLFNGIDTNIKGGNVSTAQNSYTFNVGNNQYTISGVLDKTAAEQIRDIADEQISIFGDMCAQYIPI